MKNLKRTLSLVLALVLAVGLLTVGAGAAFKDDEQITYKEAVDLLTGLGVINGYPEDNTFRPTENFNRAGLAKMVAYFCWGGADKSALYSGLNIFSDYGDSSTNWAKGSINYGYNAGYISGYAQGDKMVYNPTGVVKGSELAKTLLVVLGYKADAEDPAYTLVGSAWELNAIRMAEAEGLFDGLVNFDPTADLTREQAAQIFKNALSKNVYTSYNNDKTPDGIKVIAAMAKYFPAWKDSSTGTDADVYGRPVKTLTNGKSTIKMTIAPIAAYANDFTKAVADKLTKDGYNVSNAKFTYNGGIDTNMDTFAELYLANGGAVNGYNVELYASDATSPKTITDVVITEGYFAIIGDFTAARGNTPASVKVSVYEAGKMNNTAGEPTVLTGVDDADDAGDIYNALAAYKTGDAVMVYCKAGWDVNHTILGVESVTAVSGTISKVTQGSYNCTSTLVLNGTTYGMNNELVGGKKLTAGLEGTLYLDSHGNGIGWVGKTEVTTDKAIAVVSSYITLENGKMVNKVDGILSSGASTTLTVDQAGYTEYAVYTYAETTQGSGVYKLTSVSNTTASNGATVKITGATIGATTKTLGGCYFASGVKFIFVDKNAKAYTVKDGIQMINNVDVYATISTVGTVNYITALYVEGAPAGGSVTSSDVLYVTNRTGSISVLVDGKAVTMDTYDAYVNGVKVDDFYTAHTDNAFAAGFYKSVKTEATGAYVLENNGYTTTGTTAVISATNATAYVAGILTVNNVQLDVSGATVVDLTANQTGLTGTAKVSVVYSNTNNVASCVYVVD